MYHKLVLLHNKFFVAEINCRC